MADSEGRASVSRATADWSMFVDQTVSVLYCPAPVGLVDHMTLALGIYTDEGILLAADGWITRDEIGGPRIVTRTAEKLHRLGRFGVAMAGLPSLTDSLVEVLKGAGVETADIDVRTARDLSSKVVREFMIDRFGGQPQENWPKGALLFAGYDGATPRMWVVHARVGYHPSEFAGWIGNERGGVATDALAGLLLNGWKERAPLSAAKRFAALALGAAHDNDPRVGPLFRIGIVTAGAGYRDISAEIPALLQESVDATARLRDVFSAGRVL